MTQTEQLTSQLDGTDSLAIVCHDNPDPDALASALALERIATHLDVSDVRILHSGDISHQQNRTFVNLLDVDLHTYSETDLDDFDSIALVDQSTPGQNNQLPADADVDVVIDHHSTEDPVAEFVDVRDDMGSTAVILVDYLRALDVDVDGELATALLFALRTETDDFLRSTSENTYEAAAFLHSAVDMDALRRLDESPYSAQTLDAIGTAIRTREVQSAYLVAHVERTAERDALPQAAEYLLNLEGVETVLVFGILGDTVHMSARSADSRVHIGEVLGEVFGDVGDAGGHEDKAAAQVSLGLCADATDEDQLLDLVTRIVKRRFFEAAGFEDRDDDRDDGEE